MESRNGCQTVGVRSRRPEPAWRDIRFTIDDARRALPYVERVVRDASHALAIVQDARIRLAVDPNGTGRDWLCARRDEALRRLNHTIDECHAVGVAFLDLTGGMVAFHSSVNARDVSLIWRLGEPTDSAWRELHKPARV